MGKLATNPCGSCPYRRDVPAGIWAAEEYEKLPAYDLPTGDQPIGAFFCHQQDGSLCAGWVGCHDMGESMGLRMAFHQGLITELDFTHALYYETSVPLFASGAEAALHGLSGVATPEPAARRAIDKLQRRGRWAKL